MNRTDLQRLAHERVRDAETLLKAGQWSGAYYLAGYAIELALKACIAKLTKEHDFPDKEQALRCFTHDFMALIRAAGLEAERFSDSTANPPLGANWQTVRDWSEKSRYQNWTEDKARSLFQAITEPEHGVTQWIIKRW